MFFDRFRVDALEVLQIHLVVITFKDVAGFRNRLNPPVSHLFQNSVIGVTQLKGLFFVSASLAIK